MNHERTWLVANAASGSSNDEQLAGLRELLRQSLAGETLLPKAPLPTPRQLDRAGVATVVAFGGDGTVNGLVSSLAEWGGAVLVLPGGTQNLLSHSLHGESDTQDIVERFAQGSLTRTIIPLIISPRGQALSEVLAGPGATWSDLRESMRDGDLGAMAANLAEAVRQSAGGPPVSLVEPPLGRPEGYPAVRLSPCGNSIAIAGYGPDGVAEYARQGAAILRRDFRNGPHDSLGCHPSVTCRSDHPIELMFDGERTTGPCEIRFAVKPCPVAFLRSAISQQPDCR